MTERQAEYGTKQFKQAREFYIGIPCSKRTGSSRDNQWTPERILGLRIDLLMTRKMFAHRLKCAPHIIKELEDGEIPPSQVTQVLMYELEKIINKENK